MCIRDRAVLRAKLNNAEIDEGLMAKHWSKDYTEAKIKLKIPDAPKIVNQTQEPANTLISNVPAPKSRKRKESATQSVNSKSEKRDRDKKKEKKERKKKEKKDKKRRKKENASGEK